jgi:tetratricopeptide (TPR) repeat protein
MEKVSKSPQVFVQKHLPLILGAAALLFYGITLTHWVTFKSIGNIARVAGWDWRPTFVQPLYFLLTLPIRWLPGSLQIVGANLFSAVCGSLSLALLARCVAIFPHDRTRDQRGMERSEFSFLSIPLAWLPVIFAVLACGLQLTFWENAITATPEALDLLIFAFVVRCVLEYRIVQKRSWLYKAALVYGLGITNNFAMIAFFPAFVIALAWIGGRQLWNARLLGRLALLGLAGLSLYLLLPLYQSTAGLEGLGFLDMLRFNLGNQKNFVLHYPKFVIFLVSLTSVLPVLFIGIKWPASFGDINAMGNALTNLMMHVIHAVFLLACLYVTFDPSFSPRKLVNETMSFLPLYFLGALSIGYYSGYFLLVFKGTTGPKTWQKQRGLRKALNYAVAGLVCIAFVATPAALAYRNYPKIKLTCGKELSQFGELALQSLGTRGGVVLSDDPFRLYSLFAALGSKGMVDKYVLVETASLPHKFYQQHLRKQYGPGWPELPSALKAADQVDPSTLVQTLQQLSKNKDIYYLHPSFGYYFENFYLKPQKLVFQLRPYPEGSVIPPAFTASEIQESFAFWKGISDEQLKPLRHVDGLKRKRNKDAYTPANDLGWFYARSLDFIGVELQRAGDKEKAGEIFALAKEFDPQNGIAMINYDFNRSLIAGKPEIGKYSEEATKLLTAYNGNMDAMLGRCGPMDEPALCALIAQIFEKGQNYKQAAQFLSRFTAFQPEDMTAKISMVRLYVRARQSELALNMIADLRSKSASLTEENKAELTQYEAWAYAGRQDLNQAEKILQGALVQFPKSAEQLNNTMVEIYLGAGKLTNAFTILQSQITAQPENVNPMINFAALKIRNREFADAIEMTDRILKLQPQNTFALMNRAIACLETDRLDDAEKAYRQLLLILETPPYSIYYGLGEINYRKKNKNEAIKNFEKYLMMIAAKSPEAKIVKDRIKNLKSGTF